MAETRRFRNLPVMSFVEHLPAARWRESIVAYWVRRTGAQNETAGRRVYADGCADLIYNAGNSTALFYPKALPTEPIPLHPGRLYLGGTMTAYALVSSEPGCLLTGIRFRPGGFYALFGLTMEPAVDAVIEFPEEELQLSMQEPEELEQRLDRWFDSRIEPPPGKYDFAVIRRTVYRSGGQVSVEELAKVAHVSSRTLERIFKENVGIPPKEFLRIARFQEVLKRLRQIAGSPVTEESLMRIAFEFGYYDHAHLTNEFKKYSGILPSELSHFYKTGIAGDLYF
jgi:AraC-like DNA-binding protein